MKKLIALYFVLLASNSFAGGRWYFWRCFLDVRETRWQRGGDPIEGAGKTKAEAIRDVYDTCESQHKREYPGLCKIYETEIPDSMYCQRDFKYVLPW